MAVPGMWVKHEESGRVKRVALVEKKLPVSAIAALWKLEPSSLCIGEDELLLFQPSSGNSVLDAQAIAETARSMRLGDGSSKSSALPITGEPCNPATGSDDALHRWLRRIESRSERHSEKKRKVEPKPNGVNEQKRRFFYQGEGMHAYTYRMRTSGLSQDAMVPVLEQEIRGANIIGWLHVVSAGESPEPENRRGMVTLVAPRGTCVTSYACMGGTLASGERYVVDMAGECYECTGSRQYGVGLLEPLADCQQSFPVCARVAPVWGTYSEAHSVTMVERESEQEIVLVEGINMGFDGSFEDPWMGYRYVMLAYGRADIPAGAPLLAYDGSLSGVVIGVGELPEGPWRSDMSPSQFPRTTGDFTAGMADTMLQRVERHAGAKLLVYFTGVEGKFDTPELEWERNFAAQS